jgi:HD-GYP domain-containing protein (c-di-GMP phosphodiesterase class II)
MNPVTRYPIHDLDDQLLVPAGTELSSAFMANLCAGNPNQYESVPLLQHGTILKDLMRHFTTPPYDGIFSQERLTLQALTMLEQVNLPLPILKGLDYFKENDVHTYQHMLIISALSSVIYQQIHPTFPQQNGKVNTFFGPSHDLGKIAVPLEVLLKRTPLTYAEHDLLKHHALTGYVLVGYYLKNENSSAAIITRDHHERRNGSGYPSGMHQQDLTVEITTVCDIYDALVAPRPYRPDAFNNRSAIEELTWMAQRGEIGWQAVEVLVAFNRHDRPDIADIQISRERRGKSPINNSYGKFTEN